MVSIKSVLILSTLCLVAFMASAARPVNHITAEQEVMFTAWSLEHGKTYESSSLRAHAMNNFIHNVKEIQEHNSNAARTFEKKVNKFSDLSYDEFKAKYTGLLPTHTEMYKNLPVANFELKDLPTSVDWRTQGAVTPVKDQGQCGSCWTFSTTGAIEGAVAVATGKLTSLSEQEIVDCSHNGGCWAQGCGQNAGCGGGIPWWAMEWVVQQGGIASEEHYTAYSATDGTCTETSSTPRDATISSFAMITPNNEVALMAAVAQQPVSICVDANPFQSYSSGILSVSCSGGIDHAVLLVGYDTDAATNTPYWIVKNSWATTWGEQGYVRLARGQNTVCILNYPSVAIAGTPPPTPAAPPPSPPVRCNGSIFSKTPVYCPTFPQCCCSKHFTFICESYICCDQGSHCSDNKCVSD